jgi:hypothetical protein
MDWIGLENPLSKLRFMAGFFLGVIFVKVSLGLNASWVGFGSSQCQK